MRGPFIAEVFTVRKPLAANSRTIAGHHGAMHSNMLRCAQFLCATGLLLCGLAAAQGAVTGRIVGVLDGDTVDLLDSDKQVRRIRLEGIDAPEKAQPFGAASARALAEIVYKHEVTAECGKRDRHGREICRVLVGDTDVCLEQVRAGMAWHFKRYAKEQPADRRDQYAEAELRATAARRGLWADSEPIPPWDWRQSKQPQR